MSTSLSANKMGNINIKTEQVFHCKIKDIKEELAMIQTIFGKGKCGWTFLFLPGQNADLAGWKAWNIEN